MATVAIKSADRDRVEQAVSAYAADLRNRHPVVEEILWFGSRVNGTPTPGSDVDLCVVLTRSDRPFRDRIPGLLPFGFPVGIDLFPYTRKELDELCSTSPELHRAITSGRKM